MILSVVFFEILIHQDLQAEHIARGIEDLDEVTCLILSVLVGKEVFKIVLRRDGLIPAEVVSLSFSKLVGDGREAHLSRDVSRKRILMVIVALSADGGYCRVLVHHLGACHVLDKGVLGIGLCCAGHCNITAVDVGDKLAPVNNQHACIRKLGERVDYVSSVAGVGVGVNEVGYLLGILEEIRDLVEGILEA